MFSKTRVNSCFKCKRNLDGIIGSEMELIFVDCINVQKSTNHSQTKNEALSHFFLACTYYIHI